MTPFLLFTNQLSYNFNMRMTIHPAQKKRRPTTSKERLMRQYRFAKKSFAIDGIHLSYEVSKTFEDCIEAGCSVEQLQKHLQSHLDQYS